jgi:NADH-quinone oxidoreductase subunit A
VACLLAGITWAFVPKRYRTQKTSPYECGFQSFGSAKFNFDVQFFIVAILFVIFDVEIIFMYPWAKSLGYTGFWGFFTMLVFVGILTVGFFYEWVKGALNWKPKYGKKP